MVSVRSIRAPFCRPGFDVAACGGGGDTQEEAAILDAFSAFRDEVRSPRQNPRCVTSARHQTAHVGMPSQVRTLARSEAEPHESLLAACDLGRLEDRPNGHVRVPRL